MYAFKESTQFPQVKSVVNAKVPAFKDNQIKWQSVLQNFDSASVTAASQSKTPEALTKHKKGQILGK